MDAKWRANFTPTKTENTLKKINSKIAPLFFPGYTIEQRQNKKYYKFNTNTEATIEAHN